MTVKVHKTAAMNKERELLAREASLAEKERHLVAVLAKKDAEVAALQKHVAQIQRAGARYGKEDVEAAVRIAVARREEELRVLITQREKEVQAAMAKREEEIQEAVRIREQKVYEAWARREAEITKEVDIRRRSLEQSADAIKKKEEDLKAEEVRLSSIREELEDKVAKWDESVKSMVSPHLVMHILNC
jgi:NIMA (never in mitosis gene a)-related kinase 2